VQIQIYGENWGPPLVTSIYHIVGNGAGPLVGELLRLGGQIEVLLGEAAGIVGGKSETHTVVADIDVGMVAGLLGQLADLVYKAQGSDKILELKGFDQFASYDLPAREAGEAGLSFLRGKRRHGLDLLGFIIDPALKV